MREKIIFVTKEIKFVSKEIRLTTKEIIVIVIVSQIFEVSLSSIDRPCETC